MAAALYAYRDLETIPVLINLLADNLALADSKQAENLLNDLAGELSPKITVQADETSRKRCRDTWEEWWKTYDGPGLLAALRKQTPSEEDRAKIVSLISQLTTDGEPRQKAITELGTMGLPAVSLVRQAARPGEKARAGASQVLKSLESKGPPPSIVDIARLLKMRPAAGAVDALLAYLPAAEDESLEEICSALGTLGVVDGKPDRLLTAALTDKVPARRAGAAVALVRAKVKESLPAIQKLLEDPEPAVRLQVALALTTQGQKEAVPTLIELLAQPARQSRLGGGRPPLPNRRSQAADGHAQ